MPVLRRTLHEQRLACESPPSSPAAHHAVPPCGAGAEVTGGLLAVRGAGDAVRMPRRGGTATGAAGEASRLGTWRWLGGVADVACAAITAFAPAVAAPTPSLIIACACLQCVDAEAAVYLRSAAALAAADAPTGRCCASTARRPVDARRRTDGQCPRRSALAFSIFGTRQQAWHVTCILADFVPVSSTILAQAPLGTAMAVAAR